MLPQNRGVYEGPPIHTLTIFANPVLADKPGLEEAGVEVVRPGVQPPAEGDWHTLYFLPGLHDIGPSFTVHRDKRYYIPGEAVVYGTLSNDDWDEGTNITILGHGTLAGDRLPHPDYSGLPRDEFWRYSPVHISGTRDTRVLGLTIANSAFHSLMLTTRPLDPARPTEVKWVKDSAANRLIGEVVQSRRRPLLGPSPG